MKDSLQVTVIVPARRAGAFIEQSVDRLVTFLESRYAAGDFEIVVVPNKRVEESWDDTLSAVTGAAAKFPGVVRVVPLPRCLGKGSAVRYGFFAARGRWIFLTDADLSCDLDFFDRAAAALERGEHFIAGNRRLLESRFDSPVSLLRLIYRRHRLGVNFNRLVRWLLRVDTHDTQCGIKAMSWEFARKVFLAQVCPGFLADVEYFLVQRENGYRLTEFPVRLSLRHEKSTVRLFRETIAIAKWLPRLRFRQWRGRYRFPQATSHLPTKITADDWGMSPGVNEGILELIRLGIVRRVSMLANAPYLSYRLDELLAAGDVERGLHFDLTSQWAPLRLSLSRALNLLWGKGTESIRGEFWRQKGALESNGVAVTYLDAHHHVHVLPGVSQCLAPILREGNIRYVRMPMDPSDWSPRGTVLRLMSLWTRRIYRGAGIPFHPFFYPRPVHFTESLKLLCDVERYSACEIPVHPAAYDDFDELNYRDIYRDRVWELGVLRTLFRTTPDASQ